MASRIKKGIPHSAGKKGKRPPARQPSPSQQWMETTERTAAQMLARPGSEIKVSGWNDCVTYWSQQSQRDPTTDVAPAPQKLADADLQADQQLEKEDGNEG